MGYPTKVQLIKRKASEQWYVNFPAAAAKMMDFQKGEVVEWSVEDRETLVLTRRDAPLGALEKKGSRPDCSASSVSCGTDAARPSGSGGTGNGDSTS